MAASQLHAERLLKAPCGLATDKEDNFYIVDLQNGRGAIYKHDPDGKRLSEPTEGFANDGIGDIALDKANGIIYFTTPSSPYIWKLDLNGEVPYKPEHFALWDTTGLAVDSAGNVYVAAADSLRKLNRNGDSVATVQLGDVSKVLAVDSQGRIYYATDQGKKLKRATPKCETPQYEGDYTLEDIDTGGAYDVVAIDEADNL
ncbi:MAG TPA: hypothetical protein VIT23_13725, partial [Terrimicrobiaceae bacterium]